MDGTSGSPGGHSSDGVNFWRHTSETPENRNSPRANHNRRNTDGGSTSDRVTALDVDSRTAESESSADDDMDSASRPDAQGSRPGLPKMHSRPLSPSIAIASVNAERLSARHIAPVSPPRSVSPTSPATGSQASASSLLSRQRSAKAWSQLIIAARSNNVAQIDFLLKHGSNKSDNDTGDRKPADVNEADHKGYTAAHHAACKGSNRALLTLLQQGAQTDMLSADGATATMLAAKKGRCIAVEILLTYDNVPATSDSQSSLSASSAKHNLHRYEEAARQWRDMEEAERQENLSKAVYAGKFDTAARMIAAGGMDPDFADQPGLPLLSHAARRGSIDIVRLLLCVGAKVNGIDDGETSPLMHAVMAQQVAVIAVLLQAGASIDQQREDGESALTLAVRADSTEVVHALVDGEKGFPRNGKASKTLIALAIKFGSRNIAQEQLPLGGDLPNSDGTLSLAVCAKNGDLIGLQFLLSAGANLDHRSYDGHTAFTLAAANGHVGVVHALLVHRRQAAVADADNSIRALLKQTDHHGRTALMLAALNGHTAMVDILLRQGSDLHARDINGMNALLWAVAKADGAMVNLLSNHRATHRLFDHAGNSGIMIAARYGNLDTLKVLLLPIYANDLYNINTPNKEKDTALTIAAANGNEPIVKELLHAKAKVLHVNAIGRSAKLEAAAHGHTAIVELLEAAEQKALSASQSMTGILAPLANIPLLGPLLLQASSVKIPEVDRQGNSSLALAARYGHEAMVSHLINPTDHALDLSMTTIRQQDGFRLLQDPDCNRMRDDLLARWDVPAIASPVDIDRQNNKGLTPLYLAIANGHEQTARILVQHGALVNHASPDGITPLWLAATMPKYRPGTLQNENSAFTQEQGDAIIQMLLDASTDIDGLSRNGQTPLHAAATSGRLTAVELLVSNKANLNMQDGRGISALGHAAKNGHIPVVEYLLSQGASPHVAAGVHSPLILAAGNGHDDIVMLLAQNGANVHHLGFNGRTALIVAAFHGMISTVALMLKLGANLHYACRDGFTALDHATHAGHADIIALLRAGHPAPRDK